jgi:enoyl-CoA hydratase/carnithine racemase
MKKLNAGFEDYATRYENIRMERSADGVLEVTFHTDGKSLVWSSVAHDEVAYAFGDIASDAENSVVILTGAGDVFCTELDLASFSLSRPSEWTHVIFEGQKLMNNLLAIEVPIIAAVNGPALVHPDIPLLCDFTLAADHAEFQDLAHYPGGLVPGDGAHVAWMHVLGPKRGPYFLMMGEKLDAQRALEYGVVNEVVDRGQLMARARELAAMLAAKPFVARRNTRALLTREWKRIMNDQLALGLTYEALGVLDLTAG